MIILDTNVLSEIIKRQPAPEVTSWMRGLSETPIATTEITVAEILGGLALLPAGRRQQELERSFLKVLSHPAFTPLPFDRGAALAYASIRQERQEQGLHHAPVDHLIAAVARSAGGAVATRNVGDFEGCGIDVIEPWAEDRAH